MKGLGTRPYLDIVIAPEPKGRMIGVVEVDCGVELTFKMSALTGALAVCACGADHTTYIQEKLQGHQPEVWAQRLEHYEPTEHPWHHDTEARADQHLQD